jgi:hypothetical protein
MRLAISICYVSTLYETNHIKYTPASACQDGTDSMNGYVVLSNQERDVTQLGHGQDVLETVTQAARALEGHSVDVVYLAEIFHAG